MRRGKQRYPVHAQAVHGWIPVELEKWEPTLHGSPHGEESKVLSRMPSKWQVRFSTGSVRKRDKNRALRLPNGNVKIFGTSCGMVSPPTERSEGPETRGGLVTHGTLSRLLLKCAGGR